MVILADSESLTYRHDIYLNNFRNEMTMERWRWVGMRDAPNSLSKLCRSVDLKVPRDQKHPNGFLTFQFY